MEIRRLAKLLLAFCVAFSTPASLAGVTVTIDDDVAANTIIVPSQIQVSGNLIDAQTGMQAPPGEDQPPNEQFVDEVLLYLNGRQRMPNPSIGDPGSQVFQFDSGRADIMWFSGPDARYGGEVSADETSAIVGTFYIQVDAKLRGSIVDSATKTVSISDDDFGF